MNEYNNNHDDLSYVFRYESVKKDYIAKTWDIEQQNILQVWAEKASGWAWLHDKSARYYSTQSDRFMYPSIILNTIAGGIGFVSFKSEHIKYIIAAMNIISGLLTSFQKFLRSTEKAETHIHYSKIFSSFTRKITLELSLNPKDRRNCIEFCKICRDEYDRAVTDCPIIPEYVIELFREKFKNEKNKPEVANGLFHFNNYSVLLNNINNNQNNSEPSTPISNNSTEYKISNNLFYTNNI